LLHRAANAITVWGILAGIPRPPYTRRNALVVETTGRRSGRRRRVPVGFLEDAGKVVVVVEDGLRSHWVRNALAEDGRLKVHFKGEWHEARLRVRAGGPEEWLRRMGRVHAALVRRHSTAPGLVEIELF
jgi:deazaflavin-dependent oxidoreductase (nitroreductase family)